MHNNDKHTYYVLSLDLNLPLVWQHREQEHYPPGHTSKYQSYNSRLKRSSVLDPELDLDPGKERIWILDPDFSVWNIFIDFMMIFN